MALYNLTGIQDPNATIIDLVLFANQSSNEYLLGMFVIGLFFIMMFVFKKGAFEDGLLSASLICFSISALLWYIELLNFYIPLAFLALLSFTALYIWMSKN